MVEPPAGALGTPGQVSLRPLGVATITLAGRVSTKSADKVAATALVLPRVRVSWLVLPGAMVSG